MIVLRHLGLSVVELWFAGDIPDDVTADLVRLRRPPTPMVGAHELPSRTLQTVLTSDVEEIFRTFRSDTRNEIRHALGDGTIEVAHYPEPSPELLARFAEFSAGRAEGVRRLLQEIKPYADGQLLQLSSASCGGDPLVWHACIAGREWATLKYSASRFRETSDREYRRLVSRANRFLHWSDIQHFKASGASVFDWGGWYGGSTDKQRLQINHFKESFGGKIVATNDCVYPLTKRGRAYLQLRALIRAHRQRDGM